MPFSGASDPNLPSNVSGLSLAKRRQWVGAWNGRFADCRDQGGDVGDCESSAFAVANAAIKERLIMTTDTDDKAHVEVEYWDFMSRQINQKIANYNPTGGTAERACSNCQWFINPGACAVVENYPDPIVPNGNSDLWRERVSREDQFEPLEVVIVGEREVAVKAGTKREDGVDYPAADFAVVPEADTPSGWKLRLAEDRAGNVTVAQVARAITAMQPGGFRGNRVGLTGDQKTQAVGRIGGAIGRIGGTDEQKTDLRERLDAVKTTGDRFRFLVEGPKALVDVARRRLVTLRDDDEIVTKAQTNGAGGERSGLTIYKGRDGALRFVALMSNRYRDRDKEILSEAAHEDFVRSLDADGYKAADGTPVMKAWLWHEPGTRWGEVDWAHYLNGFMVVSGTVDKGMEDVAERLANDPDIGISHGFRYLTEATDPSTITHYRSFEVSALPMWAASNPYTDLAVIQEEAKAMSDKIPDEKRGFMADKLGDGRVAALEDDTGRRDAELQRLGVDSKAKAGAASDPPADSAPAVGGETISALAAAAVKGITESPVMKELAATATKTAADVEGLATRVAALEKSDDAKVAGIFQSRVGDMEAKRASQTDGTLISKEEADKEGVPKGDFLDDIVDQMSQVAGLGLVR